MALAAFVVTVATLVGIVVVGVAVETTTAADLPEHGSTTGWTVRLVRLGILFGIPLITTCAALVVRRRTAAIAARAIATVVLVLWSLLFVFSAIIGFLPAAALMALATVQAITEDRTRPSGEAARQT